MDAADKLILSLILAGGVTVILFIWVLGYAILVESGVM